MKPIELTPAELEAVIFAVKSDLEIVEGDIENFEGEDETLRDALQKLLAAQLPKCTRDDCQNVATQSWDDLPYCHMHFTIEERMNT